MADQIVQFRQRANFRKFELKLCPDHLQYYAPDPIGRAVAGFNAPYESLPNEFDYQTFRPREVLFLLPLLVFAPVSLFHLALLEEDPQQFLIFTFCFGLLVGGLGLGLRRLLTTPYTVLATPRGKLLIAQKGEHDRILGELQARRSAALKRRAFIDQAQPAWNEVKKFQWLRDEGIISDSEFIAYREAILSPQAPADVSRLH